MKSLTVWSSQTAMMPTQMDEAFDSLVKSNSDDANTRDEVFDSLVKSNSDDADPKG